MLDDLKTNILTWLIEKHGVEDYYFIIHPKSEYNDTGKVELHTLNSESAVIVGFRNVLKGLLVDWHEKKFYY